MGWLICGCIQLAEEQVWRALGPLVSWESPSEETGWDQLGGGEEKKEERVNKYNGIIP